MKLLTVTILLFFICLEANAQNYALEFDGADDYVGIPHSASLYIGSNPYTVEFWFKAPNTNQLGSLIAKRQHYFPWNMATIGINDGTDPVSFPSSGKKITFNFGTLGGGAGNHRTITTTNDIIDGNFHHVAGVVNPVAETIVLYIDGVLQSVNTVSVGSFPLVTNTEQYTIGQANGGVNFYTGVIDDVRIWNVVRTQTQIQNNMNTELTGTESGLVSYYKMDENNSSCDVEDCNTNENHGTRIGVAGSNNLPQFSTDIPSLTDVICGATTSCTTLPVELFSFKASQQNNQVALRWKTASEENNHGFEIQKSKDGIQWQNIGWQAGRGASQSLQQYEFIDEHPFTGINYYRLKQIDFDGRFEYSTIVQVDLHLENEMELFPNPTSNTLQIKSGETGYVKIFGSAGKLVLEESYSGQFIDISGLPKGVYFLEFQSKNEDCSIHRFIKE